MLRASLVVVACALAASASARTLWHQLDGYTFDAYKAEFGKSYASDVEHETRRAYFEEQLANVRRHNADPTKAWKEGVNHMSDWSPEEFQRLLGYRKDIGYLLHKPSTSATEKVNPNNADSKDWREAGIVTDVKDQGRCGSCWSFGSAETLESHWALKTGFLHVLSEQNILDCTPNPQQCGGTGGCSGGTAELAYDQLAKTGAGLASEWTYPYTSWHGSNFACQFNASETAPVAKVTGYTKLPPNEYAPLINAIANVGPLSISVEAVTWRNYETGVYNGCNQTNPDIDHAVQLVGYGTEDNGQDYWLVRNSWTPTWGDKGYIKILRTSDEQTRCGTDISPGDGTGCAGGPATVQVCGTCGILFDNCYPTVA